MLPYDPLTQSFCPVLWPILQIIGSPSNSFFFAWYWHGVFLIPLKQQGLFDFRITNIGIFSPHMLAATRPVSWILLFLPPLHFLPFKCILYVESALWNKPNMSALYKYGSRNGILWLVKLLPSTEWSFLWYHLEPHLSKRRKPIAKFTAILHGFYLLLSSVRKWCYCIVERFPSNFQSNFNKFE